MTDLVFKICARQAWAAAVAAGRFEGADVDRRDGFIHFSTAAQVAETAARHFRGQPDLVLVAVRLADLAELRWEPSRGGALFPHLYGPLPMTAVDWVVPLPLDGAGGHVFPPRLSPQRKETSP